MRLDLVLGHGPKVAMGDGPLRIQDNREREAAAGVAKLPHKLQRRGTGNQDRVADRYRSYKFDDFRYLIDGDTDEFDPGRRQFVARDDEVRDFHTAGGAPSCPEIEHPHATVPFSQ